MQARVCELVQFTASNRCDVSLQDGDDDWYIHVDRTRSLSPREFLVAMVSVTYLDIGSTHICVCHQAVSFGISVI